jgi:ribosomal protein S27E
MVEQVYRPRRPKASPLWPCLSGPFDAILELYEEPYQSRYGFLRPIIPEVVNRFLDGGDLERGFARVRCDDCKHEYLLAFSCKGRWFCPSCHQKKVQLVRYYGWYSNKMRGQRDKHATEEAKAAGQAVVIIDVSEHKPRRIPSPKWRELAKRVREADPILCPNARKKCVSFL